MPALAIWAVVQRMGAGALSFLGKLSVWQLLLIASLLIAGVQTLRLHSEQRHNVKLEAQLSKEVAARQADRDAYQKAQADALAANKAQVTKIETQQQKVTSDVESDYQRKLDLLRRELRAPPAAAQSHSNGPAAPALPGAAGRPGGEAGVPLSDAERLRAAENELQLDEIITWVEQQTQIDPNTGAAPE